MVVTILQLYVRNEFIGGCDIIMELDRKQLRSALPEDHTNMKKQNSLSFSQNIIVPSAVERNY